MKDIAELPNDPEQLKQIIAKLQARNCYLEEQFRLAQQKQFGKSAEGHPGQGELFNEAEELVGRKIVVVANLKPRKVMGVMSQGMLLAASDEADPDLASRR